MEKMVAILFVVAFCADWVVTDWRLSNALGRWMSSRMLTLFRSFCIFESNGWLLHCFQWSMESVKKHVEPSVGNT